MEHRIGCLICMGICQVFLEFINNALPVQATVVLFSRLKGAKFVNKALFAAFPQIDPSVVGAHVQPHHVAGLYQGLGAIVQHHELYAVKALHELLEIGLIGKAVQIIIAGGKVKGGLHFQNPTYPSP